MNEEQFNTFMRRMTAMKEYLRLNDPEKYEDLNKSDMFWAPEIMPYNYSNWVNNNFEINPEDPVALTVYSFLMNQPIESLKEQMLNDLENRKR